MVEQKTTQQAAAAADTSKPETKEPARSIGEPIDSIAVRDFYTEDMVYVVEGQRYAYQPVEDRPYPYDNIHPVDPKLDKELKKEFEEFKKKKLEKIAARGSFRGAIRALSEMDE